MSPENNTPARTNSQTGAAHGHTVPMTPVEPSSREHGPGAVTSEDRARIAEEASRQEDA